MGDTPFAMPVSEQIWNQKYRFQTNREGFESDETVEDTWNRIAVACANQPRLHNDYEARMALEEQFNHALADFKLLPAGRIISGAGTERNVTLFNCFVMGDIPDDLGGIFDHLKEAALTMQQGGGIGYCFSTLRPRGALVKGVESFSSGPLTFMDVWNAMCKTIMSAGNRRGAMMATMRCDHPDIMDFITAKQDAARLRHFNMSVLCTDHFMDAVKDDLLWELTFNGKIYDTIRARDLWDAILRSTYDYAEPGVIYIDRINKENNLWFMETINSTNPCGEQPLPAYGACLLGSVNLAQMVINPFSVSAEVDWVKLEETVRTGTRLLDSVIDTSKFPLEVQRKEAELKRRQGLGITGLADLLFMTGHRYGSQEAVDVVDQIMEHVAIWAYEESIQLAKEIGPAPFCETKEAREQFIQSGFMQRMPLRIRNAIVEHGIRNSHLISIAPTGTISMYAGNVSSGIEPIFAPYYDREITGDDVNQTKRTERVQVYCVKRYFDAGFKETDPWWGHHMATAQDLTPRDHIVMQAAAQVWVDSSISKTVNVPVEISFEDFKEVYELAYKLGCKGCTTYRPNAVTGSILTVVGEDETPEAEPALEAPLAAADMRVITRGPSLEGSTYKLRWGSDAYYVTFTHTLMEEGWYAPAEIFVNTKNPEHMAWTAALTRMISAVFQRGGDVSFVSEEMKSVFDPKGGQWVAGKYVPSLVALIGITLDEHLRKIGYNRPSFDGFDSMTAGDTPTPSSVGERVPDQCSQCLGFNTQVMNGCPVCLDCGHSKCG